MYKERDDTLDLTPEAFREYRRRNGRHFNRKLCEWAVGRMTREDGDGKEYHIKMMDKEEVERILADYGIRLERNWGYDHVFAANMCKADYLGDSVPDIQHLARYVKNVIDDPDGYEGIVFGRWLSDVCNMHVEVPWEDML